MKNYICLTLFVLLFLQYENAFGQAGLPRIINYSRKATGGGTQSWAIVQGSDKLIYLANNEGLLCFNGTGFRKYPLPNRSILRSIFFDTATRRLYTGGQNEIGYFGFDGRNNPVYTDLSKLLPTVNKGFDDVWSILQENGHTYFVCPRTIINYNGKDIRALPVGNLLFSKGFRVGNELFVTTSKNKLLRLSQGKMTPADISGLPEDAEIISLLPFRDGEKLILTRHNGAYLWSGKSVVFWNAFPGEIAEGLIYTAENIGDSRIAIGTSLKGLYIINDSAQVLLHADVNSGLQNNNILSMLSDLSGNLWLGLDNGIDLIRISSPMNYLVPDGFMKGTGYAMESWNGKLWFGTNNGLFYKDKGRTTENYTLLPGTEGQIWNLQVIEGVLYIHHHEGLFSFDGSALHQVSARKGSWDIIRLKTRPGYFLQGCYSGLTLYKLNAGKLSPVSEIARFTESCRFLAEDEDGSIWISHPYKGLFRLTFSADGTQIVSEQRMNEKNKLPEQLGNYVFDLGNELVFTGNKAVYRFNRSTSTFEHHQRFEELLGKEETITRLYSSGNGRIWFIAGGRQGFISVKDESLQKQLSVEFLPAFDLQLTGGFERIRELEGSVYFTLETGFLRIPLGSGSLRNISPPEPIISSISVIDSVGRQVLLNFSAVSNPVTIELEPWERNFEVAFGTLNAFYADSIEYSTWLTGFEEGWKPWTASKVRGFSQMPYGDYELKLKCRHGGIESAVLTIPVSVKNPWYWSFWSKLLYALTAGSLLLAVIVYPQRRIKKQSRILIEEKDKHIKDQEELFKEETQRKEDTIIQLRNETLQTRLDFQSRELASATMHIVQKNNILFAIKEKLGKINKGSLDTGTNERLKEVNRLIEQDARTEKNWENFEVYFDEVYSNFIQNLRHRYPNLSQNDIRICAYLKMNLSTKEIASLMNISVRGVEITRYRLRKKLGIEKEVNLSEFIQNI